jgi:hypothetical protein
MALALAGTGGDAKSRLADSHPTAALELLLVLRSR